MTDKELRALCEAASPGPWKTDIDLYNVEDGYEACVFDGPISMLARLETGARFPEDGSSQEERDIAWGLAKNSQAVRDAAFIAAARTEVPRLLDRVALLEGLLREAGDAIDQTEPYEIDLGNRIDAALAPR